MALGAILGAAAPILGGVLGNVLSEGDRSRANDAIHNYYNLVNQLQTPDIDKMRLALEQYSSQGTLTPEMEQDILMGQRDQLQDVNLDPRLRQTYMNQLSSLEKLGQTGFSPVEQAALNKLSRDTAAQQQSKMQQLLEDQQRRGVGSSEAAMAARLISGQSAANRQAEEADRIAAMGFQRALEATAQAGKMAGDIEGSDYERAAQLAQALRNREQTNVSQRTGTQMRNIDRSNEAMAKNLLEKQRLSEANVNQRNTEQKYNKELQQQEYENKLRKMGYLQSASMAKADVHGNQADRTANMWANIGAGAGKAFAGMGPTSGNTVTTQDMPETGFKKGNMFGK